MTDLNQDSSVHAYDPAEPKAPVKRTRRIAEGEKLRDADKVERIPVKVIASDAPLRKPDWIRIRIPASPEVDRIKQL
ncbi:MAG TPA: lipoyl synthase, partial [Cellvibrionaceae bacterium]|nr:lipoyl synthase [Cellvibrionaceae bacterium]